MINPPAWDRVVRLIKACKQNALAIARRALTTFAATLPSVVGLVTSLVWPDTATISLSVWWGRSRGRSRQRYWVSGGFRAAAETRWSFFPQTNLEAVFFSRAIGSCFVVIA